jgi:uncharacterized membrane protein YdjX (TVP38/TMEM64 family)
MKANTRRWLILAGLLAGSAIALYYRDRISVEALTAGVGRLGWLAPLVFIAAYSVATVFFLPGVLFTLAGGVLFGPWFGTLYSLTGATIGASLAFLVARYLARDWVAQRAGRRLRQLIDGVDAEGWRFVAFVRLVPLFPFNLLNYALGLTRIPLTHYVLTSFLFMAPGGAAYTYLGYAGREAAAGSGATVVHKLLLALAVVASLAFFSRIVLRWRRRRGGA